MLKLGNNNIGKIYLGSNQIGKAYLGSQLVYQSGGSGPSPQLPYDAQVEYLQGDGTTYILTGIGASGGVSIKIKLVDFFTSSFASKWPFGGRQAFNSNGFGLYINSNNNKVSFAYANRTIELSPYSSYPSTSDVEIGGGTIKIGQSTTSYSTSSFSSNYNIMLFALNNGYNPIPFNVKIGSVYITNGTKTLDLIPVRKNGVGYMYDKISGEFMANTGSGAFIIGPDV